MRTGGFQRGDPRPRQPASEHPHVHRPTHRTTAVVTGASRGFGRRSPRPRDQRRPRHRRRPRAGRAGGRARELGPSFKPVVADVTDPDLAVRLIAEHRPSSLVLNAGATPQPRTHPGPDLGDLQRELEHRRPPRLRVHQRSAATARSTPVRRSISMSSGAARMGSPLSGGYAGAKATIRSSAHTPARNPNGLLGIRFVALLPEAHPRHRPRLDLRRRLRRVQRPRSRHVPRSARPTLTAEQVADAVIELSAADTAPSLLPAHHRWSGGARMSQQHREPSRPPTRRPTAARRSQSCAPPCSSSTSTRRS